MRLLDYLPCLWIEAGHPYGLNRKSRHQGTPRARTVNTTKRSTVGAEYNQLKEASGILLSYQRIRYLSLYTGLSERRARVLNPSKYQVAEIPQTSACGCCFH